MPAERLYWDDPAETDFKAEVTSVLESGDAFEVCLSRTAFYPTSGGQPFDTGTISGLAVNNVFIRNGEIIHVLEKQPSAGTVECSVNWDRRFDHMQQHTAQHLLSAVFRSSFNRKTIGFNLGQSESTVDIVGSPQIDAEFKLAESKVCDIIFRNIPVEILLMDPGSIDQRLPIDLLPEQKLRVVKVGDLDLNACGGTHVRHTGEVGLVKITGTEKIKGNVRITFVAGRRALRDYTIKQDLLFQASTILTCGTDELPDIVSKQLAAVKAGKKRIGFLEDSIAEDLAGKLISGVPAGARRIVAYKLESGSPDIAKKLALNLARNENAVAIIACPDGDSAVMIIAADKESGIDVSDALKAVREKYDGKGGGRGAFGQVGCIQIGKIDEALELAGSVLAG